MKAISLWQPWASLIADGRKTIETRPRPWHHDGRIAIHAAKHVDRAACVRFGYDPDTIVRGAVVCTVRHAGCAKFTAAFVPPDEYGDYTPGRYGYWLVEVSKLDTPIPAKGKQGIWHWVRPATNGCTHKCHTGGLNPWVADCPIRNMFHNL